jgi:hypothetical protein
MATTAASAVRAAKKRPVPDWNGDAAVLRWQARVIKRYRNAALTQWAVLSAFQAAGWPEYIGNPLTNGTGGNGKRRLQDTVKNLNRGLAKTPVRFRMAGGAMGVRWEVNLRTRKDATPT